MAHGQRAMTRITQEAAATATLPEASAGNKGRVLLAAVLTSGFMLAEVAGGLLTGSLALLADAGHMLTDAVALVLAYIAYNVERSAGHEPHDLRVRPAEDPDRLHERARGPRHRTMDRGRSGAAL